MNRRKKDALPKTELLKIVTRFQLLCLNERLNWLLGAQMAIMFYLPRSQKVMASNSLFHVTIFSPEINVSQFVWSKLHVSCEKK